MVGWIEKIDRWLDGQEKMEGLDGRKQIYEKIYVWVDRKKQMDTKMEDWMDRKKIKAVWIETIGEQLEG